MKKVFILHGWTYSIEKWNYFLQLLKEKGISTSMLPIPGLTQKLDDVWTLDDYVQWLKSLLDKESGKIILLGHSNGGRIALAYAAKYPEKLSYLILVDSAGIYHNSLPVRIKRFLFRNAANIGKKITKTKILQDLLYRLAGENDYRIASMQMRKTMINLISKDLVSILSNISIPTLIIWGERDKITPLSDGKLMNKLIKNSKLEVVYGARHSPIYTHANEVVEKIIKDVEL